MFNFFKNIFSRKKNPRGKSYPHPRANFNVFDTGRNKSESMAVAQEKYIKSAKGIIYRGVVGDNRKEEIASSFKHLDKEIRLRPEDLL